MAETKRKLQEEWEILYLTNQELLETQKKEATKARRAQEARQKEDYAQAAKESEIAVQTAAAELKRAQEQYNGYAATLPDQTTDEQFLQLLELQAAAETARRAYHAAVLPAGGYFAQGAAWWRTRGKNRREHVRHRRDE